MIRDAAWSLVLVSAAVLAAEPPPGAPVLLRAQDLSVVVEPEALRRQYDALKAMPSIVVEYSNGGPILTMAGDTGILLPQSVRNLERGASATGLLDPFRSVLLATGGETLTVLANFATNPNAREIVAEETIRGIPVLDSRVTVVMDGDTGLVLHLSASFLPDRNLPRTPALSSDRAQELAAIALAGLGDALSGTMKAHGTPSLAYYGASGIFLGGNLGKLVWVLPVTYECPTGAHESMAVWMNAISGSFVFRRPLYTNVHAGPPCRAPHPMGTWCDSGPEPLIPETYQCTSKPRMPRLRVTRVDCANRYRAAWPREPAATTYHVQRALPSAGWTEAEFVADGFLHQCTVNVDQPYLIRMRACNGCGCSGWGETLAADPAAACP